MDFASALIVCTHIRSNIKFWSVKYILDFRSASAVGISKSQLPSRLLYCDDIVILIFGLPAHVFSVKAILSVDNETQYFVSAIRRREIQSSPFGFHSENKLCSVLQP